MYAATYRCNICGMILVNEEELTKHQIIVHIDEMLQCKSCSKVFDNKQEFEKHSAEVHGNKSQSDSNFAKNTELRKKSTICNQCCSNEIWKKKKPAKEHEGHIENLLFECDGQPACLPIKTCFKDLSAQLFKITDKV